MKDQPRLPSPSDQIRVQRMEMPQRPLRLRRSLSPPPELLERPGRTILGGYRRGGKSVEREEGYNRSMYNVRENRDLSQSPPFRQFVKRSHIVDDDDDEEFVFRGAHPPPREALIDGGVKYYDMPEYRDKQDMIEYREHYGRGGGRVGLKHMIVSRPSSSRYSQERHLQDNDPSLLMPHQVVRSTLNSGRGSRTLPSSSSRILNVRHREDEEEFLFENGLHPKTRVAREYYVEEGHPLSYSDVYHAMPKSSHSKDFRSVPSGDSEDNFLPYRQESLQPYGFGKRQAKYSGFGDQDGYSDAPHSNFARDRRPCSDDCTQYHYDSISSARREHAEYNYHEHHRREETGYRPEYKRGHPSERGAYTNRDLLRPDSPVPVVDEVQYVDSPSESLRENNSRGHVLLKKEPLTDYRDIKNNLLSANNREGKPCNSGANQFGVKPSSSCEKTHLRGDYGFGRDAGPLSQKERLKRLQLSEGDPNMNKEQLSPRQRLKAEEESIYVPTERVLKRRFPIVEEMGTHNNRNISLNDRVTSRKVQVSSSNEEQWQNENSDGVFTSKRLRLGQLQHQKFGRPYEDRTSSRCYPSDDWGPSHDVPRHVQRRAIEHYTTGDENVNIKGRSRSRPLTDHNHPHPMERRNDFYESDRTWKRNPHNQYDVLTDDGIPLEDTDTPAMPDLPEDGDEFKQVVGNLFLQYAKRLNENPSTRRRYKEEGNAGSLFCIVCGRLSKDFLDTRSLVTHTFMSHRVGKRAHHLALNKAICVLMGWKSIITPSGACVYNVLPQSEAIALKEDLILWPPVVIIHNSSTLDNALDDIHVVTIEHMESILRGMGFSGGKIKVRYGKHLNESILVVKFLPTFSGLQEAEKLHKYYHESNRGREEFRKVKYENKMTTIVSKEAVPEETISKEETEKVEQKMEIMERVLYGYMGIAEDLDKLDFDMKKKSAVKSKKDIQDIADAPLIKTE